ncbi:MAG TPA: amidohydrolase [Candidatus Paceibacterota bacterium]
MHNAEQIDLDAPSGAETGIIPTALERVRELQPEMEERYVDFHEHPELGGQEVETARKIEQYLGQCGIEIKATGIGIEREAGEGKAWSKGTGIIGYIKGQDGGPTIALRADMDALPINETDKNPHHSKTPGISHACGHDLHSASLMGAAKTLQELAEKKQLPGNVVLLFQPSEEKTFQKESGAVQMVRALEENGLRDEIKAVLGLHVYRQLERGVYNLVDKGVQISSSGEIDILLSAPGGHVKDAYVLPNLNLIQAEITSRLHKEFEHLGLAQKGVIASTNTEFEPRGYNVLAERSKANWVVRIASEDYKDISQEALGKIKKVVDEVVAEFGKDKVNVELKPRPGYRPIVHREVDVTKLANDAVQAARP